LARSGVRKNNMPRNHARGEHPFPSREMSMGIGIAQKSSA
jgi:hypothetical protein